MAGSSRWRVPVYQNYDGSASSRAAAYSILPIQMARTLANTYPVRFDSQHVTPAGIDRLTRYSDIFTLYIWRVLRQIHQFNTSKGQVSGLRQPSPEHVIVTPGLIHGLVHPLDFGAVLGVCGQRREYAIVYEMKDQAKRIKVLPKVDLHGQLVDTAATVARRAVLFCSDILKDAFPWIAGQILKYLIQQPEE